MKLLITVWTLAWDTRTGTDCRVFGSERELVEYICELVSDDLSAVASTEADGIRQLLDAGKIWDAFEAWREVYKDPLDTYNWDSQELEVEVAPEAALVHG
ncbi:MAG: hypothetical protein ABIP85_21175 [Chthoniobacteraceae bacterium]